MQRRARLQVLRCEGGVQRGQLPFGGGRVLGVPYEPVEGLLQGRFRVHGHGQPLQRAPVGLLQDGLEESVLAAEVVDDRGRGSPGPLGDGRHAGAPEAVPREQLDRGVDHGPAPLHAPLLHLDGGLRVVR